MSPPFQPVELKAECNKGYVKVKQVRNISNIDFIRVKLIRHYEEIVLLDVNNNPISY